MVALAVDASWFVAVCADAAPVIDAVARNAIARHLEIMMFLHCLGEQ
jgi:delta 1-pyrroline-5-carboxylate dehydrogenase